MALRYCIQAGGPPTYKWMEKWFLDVKRLEINGLEHVGVEISLSLKEISERGSLCTIWIEVKLLEGAVPTAAVI